MRVGCFLSYGLQREKKKRVSPPSDDNKEKQKKETRRAYYSVRPAIMRHAAPPVKIQWQHEVHIHKKTTNKRLETF